MARPPREQVAGGVYHVVSRGNARALIYRDDSDRLKYLELLGKTLERTHWWLLAYCLMPNHVHLLVETPRPNLASGMQWLHGQYARYFNDRHDQVGHVFQGRYKAVRQLADEQLWQAIRYVVDNPVRAGLCTQAAQYRWSSHHGMLSGTDRLVAVQRVAWYLDGADLGTGIHRYRELVGDRDDAEMGAAGFEPATSRV